jgi:hypothetical protein
MRGRWAVPIISDTAPGHLAGAGMGYGLIVRPEK